MGSLLHLPADVHDPGDRVGDDVRDTCVAGRD